MSDTATYEANSVEELKDEIDARGLSRTGLSVKADLIKVLEDDDAGKGGGSGDDDANPAAADSDLVPTEAGDPPLLTGADVIDVERSDTAGVALGDIPVLDPRSTVGSAPRIPEGFEAAASSALGAKIENAAADLGPLGSELLEAELERRKGLSGEVLQEASGPVEVKPEGDLDDDDSDDDDA